MRLRVSAAGRHLPPLVERVDAAARGCTSSHRTIDDLARAKCIGKTYVSQVLRLKPLAPDVELTIWAGGGRWSCSLMIRWRVAVGLRGAAGRLRLNGLIGVNPKAPAMAPQHRRMALSTASRSHMLAPQELEQHPD